MVRERATEECMTIGEAYDEGYQQGRESTLKRIRECAEHLGYDDIEDLLSYAFGEEQK